MLSRFCFYRSACGRLSLAVAGAVMALLLGSPTLNARPGAPPKNSRSTAASSMQHAAKGETTRQLARTVRRKNHSRRRPRPPNLVERLRVLAHKQLPSGHSQLGRLLTGYAREAESHAESYVLEAGECYALVGVGEPSMQQLWASLWNPQQEHQLTIRDKREPWTAIRAQFSGPHQFLVRPAGGGGRYAAAVYSYPCPME